ncbi:MAG: SdiA-regulated domain-containing protein [Bacteroidetes bacterium]|nr:SdiA-regulated domain-containing protein [Bacteroidota bacterium]MBP6402189.1 SdiA-regulated domain-containing protein [Bacteroidia bacterium]MBK6838507.1 SdiA-regulated domain-containing protein [Bacteroidota bacterium]MBK9526247.1 SdiA-regulated domain-containing protein [Bacteroidota bacterium]MBK9544169.1 SdiA-regulated domain-containing protein [Bacteroidota bacterium]
MILFISKFLLLLCLNLSSYFSTSLNHDNSFSGYDLSKPDTVLILPDTLREISGLTDIDTATIACIQDENGILFVYDILRNEIREQYNFHVDGDYEGITLVGKTMYILRSDGSLFEIVDYEARNFKLHHYTTGIPANNNEGLCYDPDNNRLLVACKSKPGKGPEYKDKRVIYGFDLSTKKLSDEPVFSFELPVIKAFAQEMKLNLAVREKKNGAEALIKFFPSAIAVHPVTKKLYLLSAVDHMMFIFDSTGKLEHIEQLSPKLFNKAEGITFFANGDMLITNEAQRMKPTLLRFNYLNR